MGSQKGRRARDTQNRGVRPLSERMSELAASRRSDEGRGGILLAIREEYGYRHWAVHFSGEVDELAHLFSLGIFPGFGCWFVKDHTRERVRGLDRFTVKEVSVEDWGRLSSVVGPGFGEGHVHTPEDSFLRLPGKGKVVISQEGLLLVEQYNFLDGKTDWEGSIEVGWTGHDRGPIYSPPARRPR